jgi:hypothetical protein
MPQTPTEPPSIIINEPGQNDSSTGETLSPVEYAVVDQLSENLDLNINDIDVIENKEIEFSDACLGVPLQDVMCAQVITPGRIIVLEANGVQYEYHTNDDVSQIQPATLALTWSRDGGFAGFCDRLTVFLSGEVYASQCSPQSEEVGTFSSLLSRDEREQYSAWMSKYREVTLDASDPKGVADGMSLLIKFHGLGKSKPGKPVQQEIFTWSQNLFQKLYE